jgi:serine/threonine-protein kinase
MPPVPPNQPGGPEDPHPWQNQLRAARDRNEQTQVQYLDPSQDPLRRRPQRQVARPQQQPRPQGRPQQGPPPGYGHPQQQQQYAPQPPQPQRYAPQPPAPQPQQPQRPVREPRQPRQRSANPVRIPGLGCLKGCLVMIVVMFVAGWLIWELSPLQDWIGTGKGYWEQLSDWFGTVTDWMGKLGGGSSQ